VAVDAIERLTSLSRSLQLTLDLDLVQERLFFWWQGSMAAAPLDDRWLGCLGDLGQALAVRLRPGPYSNLLIDRPRSS